MTKSLQDQIKKYWEDQYKRQRGGQTVNAVSDKITNLLGPLMNVRQRPELDPNFEWGSNSDWISFPNNGGGRVLTGNMQTRPAFPSIQQIYPQQPDESFINKIGTPLSEGAVRRSTGKVLAKGATNRNLANDANKMNPGIDVNAINAKFREQVAAANAPTPQDNIMGQIDSILNQQHGTPDRWVSPYTQADLDRIASGLMQAGNDAQAQFQASQGDIAAIYDEALNRRADIQAGLAEQLASNLNNIGIQPGAAEADAVAAQQFLNTTSNQNRASDQAFNEKLGTMTQALASQLANAARAGLLTPKQFVRGDAGSMSDADKFRLGMLTDQLDVLNGGENEPIDTKIAETFEQTNPLVPQMIASIQDPQLREEATRLYDQTKSPEGVLAELSTRLEQPREIPANYKTPFIGPVVNSFLEEVNRRRQNLSDEQAAMTQQLIDLFRQVSPTWAGVPTRRTVTQSSG